RIAQIADQPLDIEACDGGLVARRVQQRAHLLAIGHQPAQQIGAEMAACAGHEDHAAASYRNFMTIGTCRVSSVAIAMVNRPAPPHRSRIVRSPSAPRLIPWRRTRNISVRIAPIRVSVIASSAIDATRPRAS